MFSGLTAADAYGFDHSWGLHDGVVYVADRSGDGIVDRRRIFDRLGNTAGSRSRHGGDAAEYGIRRLYMPSITAVRVDGVPVTAAARTLIDCALCIPFRYALPIFDSAARKGVDMRSVKESCKGMHTDRAPIESLLGCVDANSENGGESLVRASLIADGFAVPELQVEICDPSYPARRYRVDFLWRLYDGRMIVLEYDGMAKYEKPSMTRGRTAKQVLREQNDRDRALRAAGVTTILHCTYEDVAFSNGLFMMLRDAGVPRIRVE
ncbi:hypothetical protein [Bifidobacterium platyrrhinorum]|uniref:CTP synthase n=1 Tax=Bifidobacterium platyrrhinorum TaxID=2661628 RepID=A0A6L9STE0_9BIFI|nr:hypothetical protein [Bifidobacterium platyrrhinorum]NEG55830.1 hypothetical protein [Bifidobacterium platyrrhinorum]